MNRQQEETDLVENVAELSSETSARLLKKLAMQSYVLGNIEDAICFARAALVYDENIYHHASVEHGLEKAFIMELIDNKIIDSNLKVRLTPIERKMDSAQQRDFDDDFVMLPNASMEFDKESPSSIDLIGLAADMLDTGSQEEMIEALNRVENDKDRQLILDNCDFSNLSHKQWNVISKVYSRVNIRELKLHSALNLDGKSFKALISKSNQLYRLMIKGNCLLKQGDIRDLISSQPNLRYLSLLETQHIKSLSGLIGSLSVNLVDLDLRDCALVNVNLKAPKLLTGRVGNCDNLESLILEAQSLNYFVIELCSKLKHVEVLAEKCTLDVSQNKYVQGWEDDRKLKKIFRKSRVKVIYGIHDDSSYEVGSRAQCQVIQISAMGDNGSLNVSSDIFMDEGNTLLDDNSRYPERSMTRWEKLPDTLCGYEINIQNINLTKICKRIRLNSCSGMIIVSGSGYRFDFKYVNFVNYYISFESIKDWTSTAAIEILENQYQSIQKFFAFKPWFICVGTVLRPYSIDEDDIQHKEFVKTVHQFARKNFMVGPVLTSIYLDAHIEEMHEKLLIAVNAFRYRRYKFEKNRGIIEAFESSLKYPLIEEFSSQITDVFSDKTSYRQSWILNNIWWKEVSYNHQTMIWDYLKKADFLITDFLRKVRQLDLDHSQIRTADFVEIMKKFPGLRDLTAMNCRELEGDIFAGVINSCPNIESVDFSGTKIWLINSKTPVPSLRYLTLNQCEELNKISLRAINLISLKVNNSRVTHDLIDLGDDALPHLVKLQLQSFKGKLNIVAPNLRIVDINESVELSDASVPSFEAVVRKYQDSLDPKESKSAECCLKILRRMRSSNVKGQSHNFARLFSEELYCPGAPVMSRKNIDSEESSCSGSPVMSRKNPDTDVFDSKGFN